MITTGNSGIHRQAGMELEADQYGVMTGEEVWRGDWQLILTATPVIGSVHPEVAGLFLAKKKLKKEKLDLGSVTLSYKGLDPASQTDGKGTGLQEPVFEYDSTVSEEPIQTHPDFLSVLVPAAGGHVVTESDEQHPEWPVAKPELNNCYAVFNKNGEFEGFGKDAKNGLAGVTSYMVPRVTRTATIASYQEQFDENDVGKVDGAWMITGVRRTYQGGVITNVQSAMHGGAKGWNPLIYKTTSAQI